MASLFNNTLLSDPLREASVAMTVITFLAAYIYIVYPNYGRRRRDTSALNDINHNFLHQSLFQVVTDLDDSGCVALALCHGTSLPPQSRTTDHNTLIATLSPEPGLPVPWGDLNTPAAKYQYASFIGLLAALTTNQDQCSRVFPSCPLPPADIVKVLANGHVPCGQGPGVMRRQSPS